jgi:hypothetical protein
MGGRSGKENVREWKISKQPIYEYNVMYYTVSCWV